MPSLSVLPAEAGSHGLVLVAKAGSLQFLPAKAGSHGPVPWLPAFRAQSLVASAFRRKSRRVSDVLRNYERSAIGARQHLVGLGIADARHRLRVPVDRPADAIADVRQVHQVARQRAFFDLRGQILALAAADGVDEVGVVIVASSPPGPAAWSLPMNE